MIATCCQTKRLSRQVLRYRDSAGVRYVCAPGWGCRTTAKPRKTERWPWAAFLLATADYFGARIGYFAGMGVIRQKKVKILLTGGGRCVDSEYRDGTHPPMNRRAELSTGRQPRQVLTNPIRVEARIIMADGHDSISAYGAQASGNENQQATNTPADAMLAARKAGGQ